MDIDQQFAPYSDPYTHFMRNPLPRGANVCKICFRFVDLNKKYECCFSCYGHLRNNSLDTVLPISYSEDRKQLHQVLQNYKNRREILLAEGEINRAQIGLAAVLHRFLKSHEKCAAKDAEVPNWDLVTIVPSGKSLTQTHPLKRIVADLCPTTKNRYHNLLVKSPSTQHKQQKDHVFDADKYRANENLKGKTILLVDDTWTTGASAQSAAHTLKTADAARVGLIVIGRHIDPTWKVGNTSNKELLRELPSEFDWGHCALCNKP